MTDRPRDLDHLVETHRIARDRRNAGLPVWKWKIPIKDILSSYPTAEVAIDAGTQIAKRLRRGLAGLLDTDGAVYDGDFDDIVYEFEHTEGVEHLNDSLDQLYDWADTNRLWLGI